MTALDLTASTLLATVEPGAVFSRPDAHVVDREYQKLAMKWHPDLCKDPKANAVIRHLNDLKQKALEHIEKGFWDGHNILHLHIKGGTNAWLDIQYLKHHTFELGDFYVCEHNVAYILNPGNDDLINSFMNSSHFTFPNEKMKTEMLRFLPVIGSYTEQHPKQETLDGRRILIIKKTPDQILLRDLLKFMPNLDPKHMAWMVSGLLNIACYLEYRGLTLNDISLDTIYVSPEFHSVALLGGWWYSMPGGSKLLAVPKRTLGLLPPKVIATKRASRRTDLALIKATARDIFGDITGFGPVKNVPTPMVEWARFPSTGSAQKDYSFWLNTVLEKAYGKRSFTKLDVDIKQLYKEI